MTVSCDCSVDVDLRPSVESASWRKARRSHVCVECDATIHVGELYEYSSGCWDGRWDHFSTCKPCSAIRRRYCPGGSYYGQLAGHILDCLGFDYRVVPEEEG